MPFCRRHPRLFSALASPVQRKRCIWHWPYFHVLLAISEKEAALIVGCLYLGLALIYLLICQVH